MRSVAHRLTTYFLSGLVNGVLMFVFCYVFAALVFQAPNVGLGRYVPLAAGTNTISAFFIGLCFALYSDAPISIAGPDISPTIFIAQIASLVAEQVTLDSSIPEDELEQTKLTTTLIAIMISTGCTGVTFFLLGYFRLTRFIQFVPAAVMSGFLAAIGIIIVAKAISISVGSDLSSKPGYPEFWMLFLPSLPIGLGLYFSKRLNIASPILTIPTLLFVPFAIFYTGVYASGSSLAHLRATNPCSAHQNITCSWIFPNYERSPMSRQWIESFGQPQYISWSALGTSTPQFLIMLVILCVDSLLKISATKTHLKIPEIDYDHEVLLAGKANLVTVFLVGSPGYAQLKFNTLNVGITGSNKSRIPGIFTALFNGALFLSAFPLIDYLPRFFIGGILIFAGAGFVVENLIDTWTKSRLSIFEYIIVLSIAALGQIFSLLVAVIVGVFLSFILFIFEYSKKGIIKAVINGRDYQCSVVRSGQEDSKLEHLRSRVAIIRLKGYMFFGSAAQIRDSVESLLGYSPSNSGRRQALSPAVSAIDQGRNDGTINTLVLDFEDVYGIDYTACSVLYNLMLRLVDSNKIAKMKEQGEIEGLPLSNPADRSKNSTNISVNEDKSSMATTSVTLDASKINIRPDDIGNIVSDDNDYKTRSMTSFLWKIFSRKRKGAGLSRRTTVVFSGMSDKVYRALKSEGVIDLLHELGFDVPTSYTLEEAMTRIPAPSRVKSIKIGLLRVFKYLGKHIFPKVDNLWPIESPTFRTEKLSENSLIRGGQTKQDITLERDFLDDAVAFPEEQRDSIDDCIGSKSYNSRLDTKKQVLDSQPPGTPAVREFYQSTDFPMEFRRVFSELDLAMQWVDEQLLRRASETRKKWLVFFDSFRMLHEQARLKAQYEPFEHILGGHLGDSLWKYVQPIRLIKGDYLCRSGVINPHLFLLQQGRLTSYVHLPGNRLKLLQSHRRGAFINEEAIFVEYPLSHTVIADEDSIVLALSRKDFRILEEDHPDVAFAIHRHILQGSTRVRNRLVREMNAVDSGGICKRHGHNPVTYTRLMDRFDSSVVDNNDEYAPKGYATYNQVNPNPNGTETALVFDASLRDQPQDLVDIEPQNGANRIRGFSDFDSQRQFIREPIDRHGLNSLDRLERAGTVVQESHLSSTSKNVGKLIMKQARIERTQAAETDGVFLARSKSAEALPKLSFSAGNAHESSLISREVSKNPCHTVSYNAFQDNAYLEPQGLHRLVSRNQVIHTKAAADLVYAGNHMSGFRGHNAGRLLTSRQLLTIDPDHDCTFKGHGVTNPLFFKELKQENSDDSPCFVSLKSSRFFHPGDVSGFRTLKNVHALGDIDPKFVRDNLHLSNVQKADAEACFLLAVENRFRARAVIDLNEDDFDAQNNSEEGNRRSHVGLASLFSQQLATNRLSRVLMDMGHFASDAMLESMLEDLPYVESTAVNLNQFLHIIRELSLQKLSDDDIEGLALFFKRHAQPVQEVLPTGATRPLSFCPVFPSLALTVDGLHKLLIDLGHSEDPYSLNRMFKEWSDFTVPAEGESQRPIRILQFVSLCSLMACHLKGEELDERVAQDFASLSHNKSIDGLVKVENILAKMDQESRACSLQEAEEMVFEADVSDNGAVSYEDLVSTLTTVFDSEIESQVRIMARNVFSNATQVSSDCDAAENNATK